MILFFEQAQRDYMQVSDFATQFAPLSAAYSPLAGCDCDGDCGQGDCDCSSGPDSGDTDD